MNHVADLMFSALDRNLAPVRFEGSHNVRTPRPLVNEILGQIEIKDKSILVLHNVEWLIAALYDHNGSPDNITFFSDHPDKTAFAETLGVRVINNLMDINKKFDIVVGNPPFNGDKTTIYGTRAKQLFADFTKKALTLADIVCLVLPSLWTHRKNTLKSDLIQFGLVKIVDTSSHFKINHPTCYVVAQKGFVGHTVIQSNEIVTQKLTPNDPVYLGVNQVEHTLLNKTKSKNNLGAIWGRSSIYNNDPNVGEGTTRMVKKLDTKTNNIDFDIVDSTSDNFPFYESWKVVTNINLGKPSLGLIKIVSPGIGTSGSVISLRANSESEAVNLQRYLQSKVVSFIVLKTKNTVSKTRSVFSRIPLVDLTRSWTDEELYEYFNLTQEEIDLIESHN